MHQQEFHDEIYGPLFLFWEIENIWWLFLHMELKKEVDCVKIFTSS